MKAYKIEILVIDFDGLGKDGIEQEINNVRYPNDCLSLDVKNIIEKDIGEWHDDHPLNNGETYQSEYLKLFGTV